MKSKILGTVAIAALLSFVSVQEAKAVLAFTDSSFLAVPTGSTLTFTFLGKSAADLDTLTLSLGGTTVFNNLSAIGATFTSGVVTTSPFKLTLVDSTVPATWSSDPGLNGGQQHLAFTSTFSDFGLGALPAVPAGLSAPVYYGWEDRTLTSTGTLDYNDLVFSIRINPPVRVPEPVSIALLGAGLLGLGMARSKRA